MHTSQLHGERERRTRPSRRRERQRPSLRERRRQIYADVTGEIEQRIDGGASLQEVLPITRRRGLTIEQQHALALYAWAWEQTRPPKARLLLVLGPVG